MNISKLCLGLTLVLALSCHAAEQEPGNAHGSPPAPATGEKPLAVVNGVSIPAVYGDFLRRERVARGQPEESLSDPAIRDALIMAELLAQEAVKAGLDKNPQVVALFEFQRKELLGRSMLEDYLRKNPVSEETMKAEYEKAKSKAGDTEYKVRHILVPTEKEAKEVISQLKGKKAKFEDLAKKHSKDGSAGEGGDLDWISPSGVVKEFAEALSRLKKGEYTQTPVQTRFGWHIIRVDDIRKLEFPPYEEVKPRIAQQFQQVALRNYLRELRSTAKVE